MANYGGGWSGPQREYPVHEENPLLRALQSTRGARMGGSPARGGGGGGGHVQVIPDQDSELEAQLGSRPDIIAPGEPRLDPDADPDQIERFAMQPRSFMVGGRPYQQDPRLALGRQFAQARQARGVQEQGAQDQAAIEQQKQQNRVDRLVAAGYSQKEATRQVFGGPQTVSEQQEVINTRSKDQLAKDQQMQGEIAARQKTAQQARSDLQQLLERSRSGDRSASRQLQAQKALLNDANRAHAAALKARQSNMLGGVDMGDAATDPEDAKLNAAVDEHLSDVQSTEAARQGAIAGVARAGASGAPGANGISDTDAAAFLGVRQPTTLNDGSAGTVTADPMAKYHKAFQRGALPGQTAPGQGLPPSAKPLAPDQHSAASSDPAYKAWLQQKGYDVSGVPHPDDQQEDESDDADDGVQY